jgi:hypothetical protein
MMHSTSVSTDSITKTVAGLGDTFNDPTIGITTAEAVPPRQNGFVNSGGPSPARP